MRRYKIKRDQYRKTRGNVSTIYLLKCTVCGNHLVCYQKDGLGVLKRLYLDRILEWYQNQDAICQKCGAIFGTKDLYEKEKRPVIRLYVGAVGKKKITV